MLAALSGCSGDHDATPGLANLKPVAELGQAPFAGEAQPEYRIGAFDVLEVRVFGEPDISTARIVVGTTGLIDVPVAGPVSAVGLTPAELSQRLRKALSRTVISPVVSVNVLEYGSQHVTVEGSVAKSGVYPITPGSTLLDALALAGEPDRFARQRKIVIFRDDPGGRQVALFDLHAIRAGTQIDPVLKANDRVVVGISAGSRLYADLLQMVPALALFTRF